MPRRRQVQWNDLPDELLLKILEQSGNEAGPSVTLVCARWRRVLYASQRVWQQLRIREPDSIAVDGLGEAGGRWMAGKRALLARVAPLVEELSILRSHVPLRAVGVGSPLPLGELLLGLQPAARLRALHLSLSCLGPEHAAAVASLAQLTKLSVRVLPRLPGADADATAAAALLEAAGLPAALPRLESLALQLPALSAGISVGLLALAQLTQLQLTTSGSPLPAVQGLTALTSLRVLRLVMERRVSPASLAVPPPATFPGLHEYYACSALPALELAGHRLSLCDLKISSGQACSLRLAGVRDPEQLHSLLQPGPVLPTGAQLTSLALRRCRISAAAFHSCALLAWIKSLDLEGCSSPGGIDAGLHALLQNCGQQLRLLFCVTGRADARLVAFPEQLAACGRLQCLALLCHGAPWDWPTGPYLTGLQALATSMLQHVPAVLAAATNLACLSLCRRLNDADAQALAGLPALRLLHLPGQPPELEAVAVRLQAVAGERVRVAPIPRGLPDCWVKQTWRDVLPDD